MKFQNLVPIDYSNQRVLTTKQLAEAYKVRPKNIQKNFAGAREHFTEGVHYFKVEGEALRQLKNQLQEVQSEMNRRGKSFRSAESAGSAEDRQPKSFGSAGSAAQSCRKKPPPVIQPSTTCLYLWTVQGAARHAEPVQGNLFAEPPQAHVKNTPTAPLLTDAALADKLIEVAKLMSTSTERDQVLLRAAELLTGRAF